MKDKCVDLLIKAHKKLNYIEGFRRIVLVIIGLSVLCALFCYVCTGFIFDTEKFSNNTNVKSIKTQKRITIKEFNNGYINYNTSGYVKCFPYKQQCNIDNFQTVKANEEVALENIDTKEKLELSFEMPSRLQYFTWQALDFLLIFGVALLVWGLYLGIERILVWIFAGFKKH